MSIRITPKGKIHKTCIKCGGDMPIGLFYVWVNEDTSIIIDTCKGCRQPIKKSFPEMKKCVGCGEIKPIQYFIGKDGIYCNQKCPECMKKQEIKEQRKKKMEEELNKRRLKKEQKNAKKSKKKEENWRNQPAYSSAKKWSRVRDGHKCQITGETKNLHSHHIFAGSVFIGLRYDENNFITISSNMHKKYHIYIGGTRKVNNCNLDTFLQFLDTLKFTKYGDNAMKLKQTLIERFNQKNIA